MSAFTIVTAVFVTSETHEISYGTRTNLIFKNIRNSKGKLVSKGAKMKMTKMASLFYYRKGATYRFKLSAPMPEGADWMGHPVLAEHNNVRYLIQNRNTITRMQKTPQGIRITENIASTQRAHRISTKPLSSW